MIEFIEVGKATALGIIQGLTEFIPVSSTGHLILFGELLKFKNAHTETFDIAIQLGSILAIIMIYPEEFIKLLTPKNWFKRDWNNLAIAMLPALIIGFLFHDFIKAHLFSPQTVALGLLFGGIIMWTAERFSKRPNTKAMVDVSIVQAFFIGLMQCMSLWPGFSRSGSTITGGLIMRLDHQTAAKFSFILAVPMMLVATGYDLLKSYHELTINDFSLIGVGFFVSFVVSILAVKWFLKLLQKIKLAPFAIYRIILAGIIFYWYR